VLTSTKGKKRAKGAMSIGLPGYSERLCIVRFNFFLEITMPLTKADRCRAIRFCQHPHPSTGAGGIRRQNAKRLLDCDLILLLVFF
jgi:hypothetical protein